MYVVRDKHTKSIIHINETETPKRLAPQEIYQHFDPNSMEIGRLPEGKRKIPKHFGIDSKGTIVTLTKRHAERLQDALHRPHKETAVEAKTKSPANAAPEKTIATSGHAKTRVDDQIEAEIAGKYTPGKELRLLKDYIEWLEDGQPKSDPREKVYKKMEHAIKRIRDKHTTPK